MNTIALVTAVFVATILSETCWAAQPSGSAPASPNALTAVPVRELPPERPSSGATIQSAIPSDQPTECYIAATNRTCGLAGQTDFGLRCGCRLGSGPISLGRTR